MRIVSAFRSLVLATSVLVLPASATDASIELLDAWKFQAESLEARLSALQGSDVPDILRVEISRFGRVASRLAIEGEARKEFPQDLKCIFRGMAEEANAQLDEIAHASNADHSTTARKRLLLMLGDAQIVADSMRLALEASTPSEAMTRSEDAPAQCSTGNEPLPATLTEIN